MKRRMAIPNRRLPPLPLWGGCHAPLLLSPPRRPRPRPNGRRGPAAVPPRRLLPPLSRRGAIDQLDPGLRPPPVPVGRGRTTAPLAQPRDLAAGVGGHPAALRRAASATARLGAGFPASRAEAARLAMSLPLGHP